MFQIIKGQITSLWMILGKWYRLNIHLILESTDETHQDVGVSSTQDSWNWERYLWIGFLKEQSAECLFRRLPKEMIKLIASHLVIEPKMLQHFHDKSWKTSLRAEFKKPYFKGVIKFLEDEKTRGTTIFPSESEIFNAFNLTPLDKVCVLRYMLMYRFVL